jgi:hypothetical protein
MTGGFYTVNTYRSPAGSATLSGDGRFRFRLTRVLGTGVKICCFIMLNPSTADHEADDPTIRRCVGYAKAWECSDLHVVNLFAWRTSSPEELKKAARDPLKPDIEGVAHNQRFINQSVIAAYVSGGPVICAWGGNGRLLDQDLRVMRAVPAGFFRPMALGLGKNGDPLHPLYLPKTLVPMPFRARGT